MIKTIVLSALFMIMTLAMIVSGVETSYAHHGDKSQSDQKTSSSQTPSSSDNNPPSNSPPPTNNNPPPSTDNNPPPTPSTPTTPTNNNPPPCTSDPSQCNPNPPNPGAGQNCPPGSIIIHGHCVVKGKPFPHQCPSGITLFGLNSKCPQIFPPKCRDGDGFVVGQRHCEVPRDCSIIPVGVDGARVVCPPHHRTVIVHNTHTTTIVQQPVSTISDLNLFIVTSCTADFNNGQFPATTATLCDTSIIMMHNQGLNSQLPQVDLYLKARGLLQ